MSISFKDMYEKSILNRIIGRMKNKKNYKKSKKELVKLLKKNKQLSYHDWNDYAYKNGYFSSIVIMDREDVENWEELVKKLKMNNYK